MVTYEQWNQAIISYFFEDSDPDQIVFLQTNAETLSEIAESFDPDIEDAAESLKAAVRDKVVQGRRINLREIRSTDLRKDRPPQVAFLALTVLAATLMESSDGAFHTNYYIRLNEVLFGKSIKGKPRGFDRCRFKAFWKHLQRWAQHQHDVELYLTEGASTRKYVWYPISQCLISKQDRRDVYQFFRGNELTPFSDPPDNQLEWQLRYWASEGSVKIYRYLCNESYKKSILSQVKSLLKHWDGQIPPEQPHGERHTHAPIDVQLDPFDNAEIRYWFPRRGRDEIDLETNALGIKRLKPSDSEKWFEPIPDDRCTFWGLRYRRQLQTNETKPVTYTLDPSDIWVFREDLDRDAGWLSQRNLQLYDDHLIVFRERLSERVADCLKKVCSGKIEIPNPIRVSGEKNGWFYLRVKPVKLLDVSNPELWKLSVNYRKRIRLIDGLSVKNQYGHRAYLDICLPAVFVPDFGLSDPEFLRVGEQVFTVGEDRLVTLDNTLGPGVHQLSCGSKTSELRVISPERSLFHEERPLIAALSPDAAEMPIYSKQEIAELVSGSGLWLTGARFFGSDVPPTTWGDVQTEPEIRADEPDQWLKSPAALISSIVKAAIDLKQDKASAPEWLATAIEQLDQNVALRALVQKKLGLYHKTALSYADLCNWGGR